MHLNHARFHHVSWAGETSPVGETSIRDVALEVPGAELPAAWLSQRDDPRLAWTQLLDDARDAAILAGRVTTLEQYENPVAASDDVPLQLDQLDLPQAKLRFVALA